MSESTVPVSDLTARFVELLPPLVTRGRRAEATGVLSGAGLLLGATEALAVDLLRTLTRMKAEPTRSEDWTEAVARATAARVVVARRPFTSAGRRGPEAFERAILVAMLWDFRRLVRQETDHPAPRMLWDRGLPIAIAGGEDQPEMMFLAARRIGHEFGSGLAVGFARRGAEAALDLLVPVAESGEPRVYALQVRRSL
jgi:hypothetical protein